jgi:TolB-like protein
MDFGVAKLVTAAKNTGKEPTPGSGAYMSPEHVRGEEVDQRADIWSLGVVLYEILTGQLPFKAHYEQALTYLILHEDPKPLTAFRSDISEGLLKVVAKALQKDPDNRYQSAAEFLEDLGVSCDIGTGLSERKTSIVVLPFEDISPGRDNEYFSDGLTEEIISNLSKIYSLRVISRTSAMRLKGTNKDTRTIGRELKARYLLEGSVRKAGKSLRITAQLIDAANDVTLWAEKYSGTLEDVFDIQDRVAHAIVDALKIQLSPEEKRRMAQRPIDNVYAYEFYLKANQEIHHNTEEALERALKYLNSGLGVIGENALLYAGMAYVYWQYVNIGARQEDYVGKAEEYVKKTFELEPESSKGHFLLGLIYQTFRADQQRSVYHFKRALASDPNSSEVLLWLAVGYAVVGKTFAAYPLAERLFKIDPLVPYSQSLPGIIHFYDGQFDCALECFSKAHSIEPKNPALLVWHATLLAYNRRFEEAYDMIDRGAQAAPGHFYIKLGLFMKYALRGEKEKVLPLLTPEFQSTARRDLQYSQWISAFYALLNERDKALDWLENAVNRGYINYPFISKHDPVLDNIRGDERFKKLLQRIRHEWEQFEV